MGLNVTKLRDNLKVLDSDAASLYRRISDATASVAGTNVARTQLIDLSAVQRGSNIAGTLASMKAPTLDNPCLRAPLGIPASDTYKAARLGEAFLQAISAFADNPLLKAVAKLGSLAVVENQASAGRNASTGSGFANSCKALSPSKEQARSQSIYGVASGNAIIKHIAQNQSFAGQYVGNSFGLEQSFGSQSSAFGTGTVLGTFNPPLFAEIGKFAVGYVRLAQRLGELIESWGRSFEGAFEWLHREMASRPLDPYGEPVPVWNVRLYRLAMAAYGGDPVAQALFLNEIEADDFLDSVSLVDDLLKPTFDPERPDRRKDWWLKEPAEARCWLRKRLRDIRIKKDSEREAAEKIYAQRARTELLQVEGKRIIRATARDVLDFDPDLIEFERRERETFLRQRIREMLPEILPERQLQIFWCLAHEMTIKQIAHRLGLSESTVKVHAMRMRANLRANPELMEVLRLNGTLG